MLGLKRWLRSAAVIGSLLAALVFVGTAFGVREISIDDLGFLPGVVNADGPQNLRWTNNTGMEQSVSSTEGLFDSGSIPAGGGYSMKLQIPGTHRYRSNTTNREGTIVVPLHSLPGGSTDPVAEHIPDLSFPPVADGDVAVDPRWGVPASRTRILLGFNPGVTVGQANAALAAAHATVIGGLPATGILLAQAQDSPDCTLCDSFYYLKTALASLRSDPSVDFASMSLLGTGQSVPRGPGDSATQDDPKYPVSGWTWRTTDTGGNWGLKAARFPQAWDFLESIRRNSPTATTGIVDGGFDSSHPDLGNLTVAPRVCTTGGTCRTLGNEPTYNHGTHIAGIIGATYDNDLDAQHPSKARGVDGANPVAKMVAYPSGDFNKGDFFGGKETWIADKELELFTMILSSGPTRPRVLNYSGGIAVFLGDDGKLRKDDQGNTIWWKNFPNKTCGPGADDDESPTTNPGTKDTCTPDNEDGWLKEMGQIGRTTARVAKLASLNNVMIVQAAGNDSWFFCNPPSDDCHAAIRAENRNEFAWVSANWSRTLHYDQEGLTDPILAVEALVPPSQKLAQFSNVGGDIAAPGLGILSTVSGGKYGAELGTSMAAPYVTALVGYLLGEDHFLTLAQLRHRVLDYAAPPREGSISAPRLDAFASMLAGPGAAKRLVDVNDSSADGDRRVVRTRNDDGTIGETEDDTFSPVRGEETAPDGFVDMRDFRRFRDAYLQICATGAGDPPCPAASDIELDGGDSSPKKDLNFDHCVGVEPANPDDCDAHEKDFSRFDFNGDGQISVGRHALVPLSEDGQPVAKIADGAQLTDLEVLQSQWSPNPKSSEGWGADDLMSLVRSADLELHADTLFDLGASKAEVQVRTAGDDGEPVGPKRVMKRGDGPAIVTIPLGDDLNREYEVVTTAKTMDGESESVSQQLKLSYGDDRRVDLCPGTILEADPTRVPADGNSRSTIRLELSSCEGTRDVANKPITWGLSPSTGGASLDLVPAKTDGNGKAVARFLAGTTPATYTIEATVDLGGGETQSKTVTIRTLPPLTIRYAWRQVYEDYSQSGSTRWTTTNPLTPDCTIPGVVEYCIDSWHVQLSAQNTFGARRDGTLVGGGANFALTEAASGTFGETTDSWTTSKPDGTTHFADDRNQWFVTDPHAYQDYSVQGLSADEEADGLHLANLDAVAKLPYHYSLVSTRTGGQVFATPIELGSVATSMLMVPQDEGGQIRFAAGPGQQIVFGRNPDGTLKPFQSCGRLDQDLTTQPGYYVSTPSDYIPGAVTLKRKPDYTGGDRPMPVGPGHLRVRYEFAAVASYAGQTSGDPVLPDCTANHPPTAAFDYTPQAPDEGHQVRFEDASTDVENDVSKWEWDFGDGSTASGPSAWHMYKDNGAYDVTLTVKDKDGATDSTTKQVVVANVPPEAELDDARAKVGEPLRIVSRLMDAGAIDKTQLRYSITSPNTAWPLLSGTREGNVYTDSWANLPAGTYPLTLTVTDKDGAVATATAIAVVSDDIVDPPLHDTHVYGSCDPNVKLDAEETRFLDEVNEYRAQNGVDPVAVSPTLNRAAEEHADDMATHGFLSHTGSDGSMPWDRAWKAGYPRRAANSENIASGAASGHDALWAWRGSTQGHNENMLNPEWRAIGIARRQGSGDWYWSTSYGDELDCPPPTGASSRAPLAKAALGAEESTSVPESGGGVETEVVMHKVASTATSTDTAPATPEYPPTPAFTIGTSDPISGHPVTFTNRSRDSLGNPIGATIRFGDGSEPRTLAPNESTQFAFEYASGFNVEVTAMDSAGQTAAVRRYTEVSDPPQPLIEYTGETQVISASKLAAKARVTTRDGGPGIAGLTITFKLGWDNSHTATAVTDAGGIAAADIPLDGVEPANYYLQVQFDGTPDWSGTWITAPVSIIGNEPPKADAGGPYISGFGNSLLLDASQSSDPDYGDTIAWYEWDLNGDGAYDDATGRYPLPLNWDAVRSRICGGTCEAGHDYTIRLRATDTRGASSTAPATVRFVSDFMLALGGENRTVVPGKSNSFAVSVIAAGSFTAPVTLSVDGLPDGITGDFSVNPVEPGHMSVLTLTAANDAQTGQFPVVVSGTAGGVTHTVRDDLNVAFGLIPICHGTVTGTVTDTDTGAPVAGVEVDELTDGPADVTDASGRFTFHDVHLGDSNTPLQHDLQARKADSWEAYGDGLVACGGTTTVDLQLLKKKSIQASGRVVEGEPDPVDHHSVPTDRPIANATVWASGVVGKAFTSDADGKWSGGLELGPGNTPLGYNLNASATGYWWQQKWVMAEDADQANLDFALVKQCHGTITGGTIRYTDGTPAPFHTVELRISDSERYATQSDADGHYAFNRLALLGYNNTAVSYRLTPLVNADDPPGSGGEPGQVSFQHCGDERGTDLNILRAQMRYAWLEGHVTDDRTHEPLADVAVTTLIPSSPPVVKTTTTDDTGYYKIQVGLGYGVPSARASVGGAKDGYEGAAGSAFVSEGQVGRADIQMHRPLTTDRTLTGLVRDAATGAPIAGAFLSDGCGQISLCTTTDASGRYSKTLTLDDRIGPLGRYVTATADGYWPHAQSVTLPPNETTTLNFELVHKCENATVSGTVVDAQTQLPIEGAQVVGGGAVSYADVFGHFRIEHVEPGIDNAPLQVAITASAFGYYSQTKTVTVYCGANLIVDFGKRETSLGKIAGTITNVATGQPMANVFVGTEFGGSATTDANGDYHIDAVPLGDLNSDREWKVTALPDGFASQTKTVIAKANVVVRADFVFGTMNHKPTAAAQSLSTDQDAALPLTLSGADADGDPLSYTVTHVPAHGTLSGSAPTLVYQPDAGWSGTDSFDFVASDGAESSDPATVTITVKAHENAAPTAADDATTIAEDDSTVIDVLANDSPGAGEATQHLTAELASQPKFGTASLTTSGISYKPAQDFNGTDSFEYRACDDGTPTKCATAHVLVSVTPVNDAPTVTLDPVTAAPEGSTVNLAAHGHDVDGDPLTFTWSTDGGTLASNGDTATLEVGNGPATIAVSVTVGDGAVTREAHVTVTVYDVAPDVDAGDEMSGVEGTAVALAASFADPGTGAHTATIDWGDGTVGDGSVSGHDVTGRHTYADNGAYTVTVKVEDAGGATGSDTTTANVQNAPPKADAGADTSAPWGLAVAFAGTVGDPSSADTAAGLHPTWSFGDGSPPVTDLATKHAYDNPGTYTATLGATDKDGAQASDEAAVQIVRRKTTLAVNGPTSLPSGTKTISAKLGDADDGATARLAGHDVVFELAGATYHAATDANGIATATMPAAPLTGTYTLTLRFTGDGLYEPSQATATIAIGTATTSGLVTGGGLRSSANGRGGFNVHSDGVHIWGELQYQSATAGNFHASAMTSFAVAADGRSARFGGVGADGRKFTTYVEDNGEPGMRDVWRLWIDGRLETDGTLAGGNIQIHG